MTREERSWILQDFGNSVYSIAITTALLPVFYKSVAAKEVLTEIEATANWGVAQSIGTLVIVLLAPLLSSIADYNGYKKKMFTIFVMLGIISTAALFIIQPGQWMLTLFIYILTLIGSTGSTIFYDAFLTDVTTDERMDMISSQGFGFGYLGGTIGFALCMLLITFGGKIGVDKLLATRISFIITALWWFIFTIPLFKNVRQVHYIEGVPGKFSKVFIRLYDTFREIISDRNLALFFLAYFFYIDGVHTIINMATPIGMDMGLSGETLLVILLFIQMVAFPFAIFYGFMAKIVGARLMILIGILTYTGIAIFGYFMKSTTDFWILAFLVATAQGGIQALSRSYFGKLIPKEKSAEYFGVFNIFGKVSSLLGPLLMALILKLTGSTQLSILSLIILFLAGLVIFALVRDKEPRELTERV